MGDRTPSAPGGESLEQLPLLIARLGEDLVALVASQLQLLKLEIREDATAYVRGAVYIAAGGVVVAVGVVLCTVALALLVAEALPSNLDAPLRHVAGFLLVGSALVGSGLGVALSARRRMAVRSLATLESG